MRIKTLFLVASASLLCNCKEAVNSHNWWAMNTNMAVNVYGKTDLAPDSIFARVEAETQRLADLFTDFSDQSALSSLAGKVGDTLTVNSEVERVLVTGLEMATASHGTFDMTLHDLKMLWGLGDGQSGQIPDSASLDSLLAENPTYKSPDTQSVTALPLTFLENHKVVLHRSHTRLDLGGIAKGYIVDRLHHLLDSLGCPTHLIQAGGEIRVGGHKAGKQPWLIAIRHPRIADSLCGMLKSRTPLAVSTSGDYERFFEKEGKRYHHIFDPRTGKPSSNSIAVTVVADSSLRTDALSKPLFILGPEKGAALARKYGARAVWFHETENGVCAIPMPEILDLLTLQGVALCKNP
jgi:FAD:protein FMN transferase